MDVEIKVIDVEINVVEVTGILLLVSENSLLNFKIWL